MLAEQTPGTEDPVPREKFPLGLTLILVWMGITILSSLVSLNLQSLTLGRVTLSGTSVTVYKLGEVVLLATCSYGIVKRQPWAGILAIGWFGYSFALSLFDISDDLTLLFNRRWLFEAPHSADVETYFNAVTTGKLLWDSLVGLGISAIVVVYLHRKRGFFRT